LPWTNRIGGTSVLGVTVDAVWAIAPARKLATAKGKLLTPCRIVRRDSFICSSPGKRLFALLIAT